MTLINIANDGNYPQLIALYRYLLKFGPTGKRTLISMCSLEKDDDINNTLTKWIVIGLFEEEQDLIKISDGFSPPKKASIEEMTRKLPVLCRQLILSPKNCLPLTSRNGGLTADFVRAITWVLSQNIYEFPISWSGTGVESIQSRQISLDQHVISNDVRWNGLRFWARYLGFATGDSKSFFIDPTKAVNDVIRAVFQKNSELTAGAFVRGLAFHLPVLDHGSYRAEIEKIIDERHWRRPKSDELSFSLSFALRRLELGKVLAFDERSDAGEKFTLLGKNHSVWRRFTHVRLPGRIK